MRTVGVKIPQEVWLDLEKTAENERLFHPGRKITVSDIIRERLCNGGKTKK